MDIRGPRDDTDRQGEFIAANRLSENL